MKDEALSPEPGVAGSIVSGGARVLVKKVSGFGFQVSVGLFLYPACLRKPLPGAERVSVPGCVESQRQVDITRCHCMTGP